MVRRWRGLLVLAGACLAAQVAVSASGQERCMLPQKGWSLSSAKIDVVPKRPVHRVSGLTLCSRFARNTCCGRAQTDLLYMQWKLTLVAGFSTKCSDMFETGLCMECDPNVGTGKVTKICRKTCNEWFAACKDEFFQAPEPGNLPSPCQADSLLCSPLVSFVSSGPEMCSSYGFTTGDEFCYDGVADASKVGDPEAKSYSRDRTTQKRASQQTPWEQAQRNLKKMMTHQTFKMITSFEGIVAITIGLLFFLAALNQIVKTLTSSPEEEEKRYQGQGRRLGSH